MYNEMTFVSGTSEQSHVFQV